MLFAKTSFQIIAGLLKVSYFIYFGECKGFKENGGGKSRFYINEAVICGGKPSLIRLTVESLNKLCKRAQSSARDTSGYKDTRRYNMGEEGQIRGTLEAQRGTSKCM